VVSESHGAKEQIAEAQTMSTKWLEDFEKKNADDYLRGTTAV
jgi:hypothetical protein